MAYINSIQITPQESAEALAQAAASALASALGWTAASSTTASGVSFWAVWQNEDLSGLGFVFKYSAANLLLGIGNSLTQCVNNPLSYKADTYYMLDYCDTGNTVAVGLREANGAICLSAIIAKNTLGKFKAFSLYSTYAYYLADDLSSTYLCRMDYTAVTYANAATSIVRYPDFWGECMFEDLYLILSCPYNATDKVFYIGGKYYRYVGVSGTCGFAIPVN